MTALVSQETAEQARQLTDRIKVAVEGTWQLIAEAYQSRAWSVLGYANWDDYCLREFGNARLKLPHEERMGTVRSLRQSGLSIRAIVAATGVSDKTVMKDLHQVSESTTPDRYADVRAAAIESGSLAEESIAEARAELIEELAGDLAAADSGYAEVAAAVSPKVTGIDGKQYAAMAPAGSSRRKPITDQAVALGYEIRKVMERLERLVGDDRLRTNEEQVSRAIRGHLLYAQDTVAAVLAQIP